MSELGRAKSVKEKELDENSSEEIKRYIKAHMMLNNISMADVAIKLTALGRPITEKGLSNKINKGTHQTVWYWDLMKIIKAN